MSIPVTPTPRSASSATARPAPQPTSTTSAPGAARSNSYERARSAAAPGLSSTASSWGIRAPIASLDMRAMLRLNVDMKSSATMSIGEVAGRFGLATHVLRHWETMGLLSPARVNGGRRRYGSSDLVRVATILLAKDAGLALADIRDLLTTTDIEERRRIQRRHRAQLIQRIAE